MISGLFPGKRPRSAAEWFAARHDRTKPVLELRFEKWLAEDASHREEYALCELTWEVSRGAARQMPDPRTPPRRRFTLVLQGAAALAIIAIMAFMLLMERPTSTTHSWFTAPGEQRTLILRDGSQVTLNTRTRISVRYRRGERDVYLTAGEAFFEVAKNPARPFVVHTKLGSALAVGTRFDVYLRKRALLVATEEGRVLVSSTDKNNGVLVAAGEQATLRSGAMRATVRSANLRQLLDWRVGRLEVSDAPLGRVLKEFSRYTMLPIRPATPAIADLRVTAVLKTGDIAALATALKAAFGLTVERRGAEWLVIIPKPTGAIPSGSTPPPRSRS